jgi:plasmid maintenance system antidote protein VapI
MNHAMKQYLKGNRIYQIEFARRLGVTQPYLSQIISGGKPITLKMAARISKLTNGEVPIRSWPSLQEILSEICIGHPL